MVSNFNGSEKLLCLPYFYLAGFPKCGTTDLYAHITQHHQIIPTKVKEPHWWTRKRFTSRGEIPIHASLL